LRQKREIAKKYGNKKQKQKQTQLGHKARPTLPLKEKFPFYKHEKPRTHAYRRTRISYHFPFYARGLYPEDIYPPDYLPSLGFGLLVLPSRRPQPSQTPSTPIPYSALTTFR
jgi:hypothetical protein